MNTPRLSKRTTQDIDAQVEKVLRGLGFPEPPLNLETVRALQELDFGFYSTTDTSLVREWASRLKIAGKQVLLRPTLVTDAVRAWDLRALYLPDTKRILLDKDQPVLKYRWSEAHEIGHSLIPWHADMMLGDSENELMPSCHALMEAEANYAAGRLLFLNGRFAAEAIDSAPSLTMVKTLQKQFGNTLTSTLWRYVTDVRPDLPMVGLVTGHPHAAFRKADFDFHDPCRYMIQSDAFAKRFEPVNAIELFKHVAAYCAPRRGGPLGSDEVVLKDTEGERHIFSFETFFNGHNGLTLGFWKHPAAFSTRF